MKYILYLLLASTLYAQTLTVGDTFPDMSLEDQFGKTHHITPSDRWVLLTSEKKVAIKLTNILKQKSDDFLEQKHIRIISDISAMPTFITKMFALPKMRKYPFPVMLIRDDKGKIFAKQKGMVTLFKLRRQKIVSISFMTPEELDRALSQ